MCVRSYRFVIDHPERTHLYCNTRPSQILWCQLSHRQKVLFAVNMGADLHVDSAEVERRYNSTPGKLIADFFGKQKYSLHYRALKLYLELGMTVVRVHSGLQFTQRPIFREYCGMYCLGDCILKR